MINTERMINNFLTYIQIDSESQNEKAICDYVSQQMKDLGFSVQIDNAGEKINSNGYNICIKQPGDINKDAILLSAHLDTVIPGQGIKPIIEGDLIKTDGSTILGGDDKAGVAIIVECLQVIKEKQLSSRPIEAVFSICEEIGLKGAKEFDTDVLTAKEGIVIDAGGAIGLIDIEGPAQNMINVDIYGKSAYTEVDPDVGISAIQIAAHALEHMKLHPADDRTTVNFGVIHGGVAANIIADHVHLVGEIHSLDVMELVNQTEHIKTIFEAAASDLGGSVNFNIERTYNAFSVDENSKLVRDLKQAFIDNGFQPKCVPYGGGSDTNIYSEKGIVCINLSCGMSLAHTTNESIKKSDIEACAKSLLTFLLNSH